VALQEIKRRLNRCKPKEKAKPSSDWLAFSFR